MPPVPVVPAWQTFNNERVTDPLAGPRIKQLREAKGWTQAQLAKEAGVAANTVGGLENGRQTRWEQFAKICIALGVSPQAVLTGFGLPEDYSLLRRAKLSDEAIRVGKRYQLADTVVRLAVEQLLRAGNRNPMLRLWQRLEALDPQRKETLLLSLAQHEQSFAEERRAKSGKSKPPKP